MKKKMKKLLKIFLFWPSIVIILFMFIQTNAGVTWKEMGEITHSDQLEQSYNGSNEYKKRYILKYLPKWLEMRGVPEPDWIFNAIEDALYNARDGLLIMEAVALTEKYGLSQFFESLIEIYQEAHNLNPADADKIRRAVVSALASFGGSEAEYAIPELLMTTPRYVADEEFSMLLLAVEQYGDTSLVEELENIEQNVNGRIASIDPEVDPMMHDKYVQVLSLVKSLKNELIRREGGDE